MKVNFKKLQTLIENAYAPYSHFHVASVVVWTDGSLSEGVNVENNSFGGTVCAERNAIAQGVASGNVKQNEKIAEIHIYAENHKESLRADRFVPPCGICRQTISNFKTDQTKVVLWNKKGEEKVIVFDDLMPFQFDDSFLNGND